MRRSQLCEELREDFFPRERESRSPETGELLACERNRARQLV